MTDVRNIMVLVHPGSACGSADFNLELDAGPLREALAAEIHAWTDDILIVDGELSDELDHYAVLGLIIENALEKDGRRVIRERACDFTNARWPEIVSRRFRDEWPDGPHEVVVTGAWYGDDGNGCVNAVASVLADQRITVSPNAFRL